MGSIVESIFGSLTLSSVLIYGLIFLMSWAVYKVFIYPLMSPLNKIPSRSRTSFIYGNMKEIFSQQAIDPYTNWIKEMNTSIIRYYHLLGTERILIADADAVKHVMVTNGKNYTKPKFLYSIFIRVTGYGLLSLNGKEHSTQRKLCMGAFKIAVLKNMLPSFKKHTVSMINIWRKSVESGEKVLNIHDDLHMMALDMICKCGFGYDAEALSNPDKPETKSLTAIMSYFTPSLFRMLFPSLAHSTPTAENRIFKENMTRCDNMIHSIIANKRRDLSRKKETNEDNCTDLLTMLLLARDVDSGEGLSDSNIRDHVMTFLLAGHETTSTGMCWFLLNMAQYPDVQKKLRDEVTSILSSSEEPITFDQIEKMTYLNCCIKETLRLFPPAPMTFRQALADDNINGYYIPKGTIVNIQIGAMQRNPKHWTDPEEFNPERFLDEKNIHPYAYLPFITGSRMCIGYKFALLQMKVILSMLIKQFQFDVLPDLTYTKKQFITMKPNPLLQLQASLINQD